MRTAGGGAVRNSTSVRVTVAVERRVRAAEEKQTTGLGLSVVECTREHAGPRVPEAAGRDACDDSVVQIVQQPGSC